LNYDTGSQQSLSTVEENVLIDSDLFTTIWLHRLLLIASAQINHATDLRTYADKAAILKIIDLQIDAFRLDDGAETFLYASPGIQPKLGLDDCTPRPK